MWGKKQKCRKWWNYVSFGVLNNLVILKFNYYNDVSVFNYDGEIMWNKFVNIGYVGEM